MSLRLQIVQCLHYLYFLYLYCFAVTPVYYFCLGIYSSLHARLFICLLWQHFITIEQCLHSVKYISACVTSDCLAQAFTCPLHTNGTCRTGEYPDPTSCAHWYNCIPGWISGCEQTRYQCQQFEAFDKNLKQCLLAIDAECDSEFIVPNYVSLLYVSDVCLQG